MVTRVIVGARRSKLAQAMVAEFIHRVSGCPIVEFKNRVVTTAGDQDRASTLSQVGADRSGVFSSALEEELLAGGIDIAVHSLKDLPTTPTNGLVLAVTPPRADARDVLCGATLNDLRPGARVGTGSPRRIAQLKALRPDLDIVPIRGNVPPRLAKLKHGSLDAVVLAVAGVKRLGMDAAIAEILPLDLFPPAPGQGALGIQMRAADTELKTMLDAYGDARTDAAVRAERTLLAELEGGCSVPIGATAVVTRAGLRLTAQVTGLDGTRKVTGTVLGPIEHPENLGIQLAEQLLDDGAESILAACRSVTTLQ